MSDMDLPRHFERDIAIDGRLSQMARDAVAHYIDTYIRDCGGDSKNWAVTPSQIQGLRQVACNQPARLRDFINKQLDKAEARAHDDEKKEQDKEQQVAGFWSVVQNALTDPKCSWAIARARMEAMPEHLRQKEVPKGAKLSREEQEARHIQKQERDRWERQWEAEHIPPYFRSFCIEYLYRMYNG